VAAQAQFSGRRFVIDPGHGGGDPGAVGIDGGADPNESDFVLDMAFRLKTLLEAGGATVQMTRTSDASVSLTQRVNISNAFAPDVFLSIHCNSFSSASANGTETFTYTNAPAADVNWATKVQNRMISTWNRVNRGVKQNNFTVLTANAPAALAETMFISNQAEYDIMNSATERQRAAVAYYNAFADYLGVDPAPFNITSHPATRTVNPGENAQFTVSATGTSLTYQWRRNDANLTNGSGISGATTPELTVNGAVFADGGFYTCAVTRGGTTLVSNEAQLVVAALPGPAGAGNGLRGTYYDNPDFTSLRRARLDATVNFSWGAGSPSSTMQPDTFSARWTGQVQPRLSQNYKFHVRSDDGARLWVNGVLLIDKWLDQSAEWRSASIALAAGQKYDLVLEYFENGGDATCQLYWSAYSLLKEIIPVTQLYRPPPVLTTLPGATAMQGTAFTYNAATAAAGFDPVLSSQPWADFESEADGTTDTVLFRKPQHASTTAVFSDPAKTRETTVVSALPAGNSSNHALLVKWSWQGTDPWLRLTTAGAATLPNPVVDFRKSLRFDVWSEHTLKFGLGLRETNSTGAIGSDGGLAGAVEFAGVSALNGTQPVPVRTVAPDGWRTLDFPLPDEPARGFTGNGVLESTTGLGVLEHLAIVPGSASIDHDVYLDNFVVVENNVLTWSLLSAPPGAVIDPRTGIITWTPTAAQAGTPWNFTIQAADAGIPPLAAATTFTVSAAPVPEFINLNYTGGGFSFSWKAVSGAAYDIESATSTGGPWAPVTTVNATGAVASWTGTATGSRRFFRVRLKLPPG
jgi:N-acetylmuramoyl-L-alanine amidase